MSYSFTVKVASKADAKAAVIAEFEKIVAYQPIHARDRDAVLANANAVIDLLADDDTKDVIVSCNGSVTWAGSDAPHLVPLIGAQVTCSAYHSLRT